MKQLIIKSEDIYKVNDEEYFKYKYNLNGKNYVLRDINIELKKNNRYILESIAFLCELNFKGLNKKQLIEIIEQSNCFILDN